jgi:hypothetical protein
MKQRFNDDLGYIVNCIMKKGTERSEDGLAMSIACFKAGLETRTKALKTVRELVSFRYVAAAVCLKEVDRVLG